MTLCTAGMASHNDDLRHGTALFAVLTERGWLNVVARHHGDAKERALETGKNRWILRTIRVCAVDCRAQPGVQLTEAEREERRRHMPRRAAREHRTKPRRRRAVAR